MDYRVSKVGLKVSNATGCLFIVATPIGNREDISLRALETLRRVDRVAAEDTRHSRRLLVHLGIDKPIMSLHEYNESRAAQRILDYLREGESIALISDAGTPLISDPGFPLVRACLAQGVNVIPVPGACALIAALSVSGQPTDRFRFEGFLPRKQLARRSYLRRMATETATLVFYESSHRILESLCDLRDVFGPDRAATLARELTKIHETVKPGTLGELVAWVEADDKQRRGEFVLIVGGMPAGAVGAMDSDKLLTVLLEELPIKQAATLAARVTGEKRNIIYRRALALQRER
ncbi:MAG: 16S rRNA (cytidine(1402)-2'-O)-methyltransferase [Sedimenticolaceae bacterium]